MAAADWDRHLPIGGGCFILLDPFQPIFTLHTGTASNTGRMIYTVPLPDSPYTTGSFNLQWLQLSPSATLTTSNGARTKVR